MCYRIRLYPPRLAGCRFVMLCAWRFPEPGLSHRSPHRPTIADIEAGHADGWSHSDSHSDCRSLSMSSDPTSQTVRTGTTEP